MDGIVFDVGSVHGTDRPLLSFGWVCGPHDFSILLNGVLTLQDEHNGGAGRHEGAEAVEKRPGFMDRIESFRRRLRQMHQSYSDGSEPRLLISIDDVTNNVFFYCVRLDDCERSFTHRLKFSSPVSNPT